MHHDKLPINGQRAVSMSASTWMVVRTAPSTGLPVAVAHAFPVAINEAAYQHDPLRGVFHPPKC
jgi:hypothetical protein